MAEGALFSLAGKLLIDLASSGFEKVYQRVKSIRKAKKDLDELAPTIRTIKEVLLDAEKQQEETAQVREWIQRVRDVLYGADDLFDDVATDTLLMQQQTQEKTMLSKGRSQKGMHVFFNPHGVESSVTKMTGIEHTSKHVDSSLGTNLDV